MGKIDTVGRNQNLKDLKILFLSTDPLRHSRLKGPKAQVKLAELHTGRGGRRRGAGRTGGGVSAVSAVRTNSGKSSVAYRVMQNRNLEYGERRCGFITKHQSTKLFKIVGRGMMFKSLPDMFMFRRPDPLLSPKGSMAFIRRQAVTLARAGTWFRGLGLDGISNGRAARAARTGPRQHGTGVPRS